MPQVKLGNADAPDPCKQDIYDNGVTVGIIAGADPHTIEAYVRHVAEDAGEPVDWHYCGGRAVVKTTGDSKKVQRELKDNMLQLYITDL